MKRNIPCFICMLLLCLAVGTCLVGAESLDTMPEGYAQIEEDLPKEISDLLPDGLFSEDVQEAARAAETLTRPEYLFRVVLEAVGLRLGEAVELLAALLALLLLSALLHRLRETVSGGGEGVAFCLRLCMYALIITRAASMVTLVKNFFSGLSSLLTALLPVMGTAYALGGNLTQAAVNEEILLLFLNVCDYVTAAVTPAMCGVCMAFALLDAFGGGMQVRFSPLGGLIKKWYTTLLGGVMFLISIALSAQSILAAGTDSLSMRGIKYAVGQGIPVVGGAISGTLSTVAAGLKLIRGVSGVCGLVLLGLLLLPAIIQLMLFRMCYQMAAAVASMLGCDGEGRLLGEVGSLYGYMIAAISICAVVFVLALAIFAHGVTAL